MDTGHPGPDEPAQTADGVAEAGGDPVCWAHLVCAECGAIVSEGHRDGCPSARGGAMTGWGGEIRRARGGDLDEVAALAAELAMSFEFAPDAFRANYPALLADEQACLLLATDGPEIVGYLLGFRHLTFYANGPVGWVEEIVVRETRRGTGAGRALMSGFEQWAGDGGCVLVALATRRAAPFYRALGYEESATYFRKFMDGHAPR